eukprot:4771875-Pyramimonas_sp.AAC.1
MMRATWGGRGTGKDLDDAVPTQSQEVLQPAPASADLTTYHPRTHPLARHFRLLLPRPHRSSPCSPLPPPSPPPASPPDGPPFLPLLM